MSKLLSAMLAAIPKRLKYIVCPTKESPTPIDILLGVIRNVKSMNSSQQIQWKTKSESLIFDQQKGLEALLAEHDDIMHNFSLPIYISLD